MVFRFARVELDEEAYELRCDGVPQRVEPKVLDLLLYMVRHRDRLVTKNELLDHVWPGTVVAESALTRAMSLARAAVGDTGRGQAIIETVSGKGYRFRGLLAEPSPEPAATPPNVRRATRKRVVYAIGGLLLILPLVTWLTWPALLGLYMDAAGLADPPRNPPLPDRPSIAVLPFVDLGPDGNQAYLAEGISDELTADLGRLRELFVISRSSAFTYRGGAVDVKRVGRELGVQYVVDGSLRAVDGQAVVTTQLIDASNGFQLWSGRYEREVGAVLELQSEISAAILSAIGVRIGEAEVERARRMRRSDAGVYATYVVAQTHWFRFTRADNARAESLLNEVLAIEPDDAHSHALMASTHLAAYVLGWDPRPERLQRGRAAALRAIELDPFAARGYASLAIASLWMDRREEALVAARRAVEVGPNSDLCHGVRAMALAADGSVGAAIDSLNRALRLNPRAPSLYWMLLGYMYEAAGDGGRAAATWEQVRVANPDMIPPRLELLRYYDNEARGEQASTMAAEMLRINPALTADVALTLDRRHTDPADAARLRAQLGRAGIP